MTRNSLIILFWFYFFGVSAQNHSERAIINAMQKQQEAWNGGNIEEFMAYYWKSDSLKFIGSKGITYGWQKTLDNYKRAYPDKAAMGQLTFTLMEVKQLSKQYVHVIGKWALEKEKPVGGFFTLLWKKVGGCWVILSDHTS